MSDDLPCVCGRLRRTSRALTRLYDEALAPTGLTVTQFSVMRTLGRLEHPNLAELAEATAHEKSALWRTLQPLVKKGWVASAPVAGKRGGRLAVTDVGRGKLEEAMPGWRAAQARVSETLGPREAALIELLSEVEAHV
ncbi:MarR family winged helix-turn-helix transcriptional regulator [Brevundimonas sp. Root1279]|uniref:MarR family winged helix-turn-helix transcriptional regulator n=1 Tax=Brevundimonas sp. Root1279 TaxID=1736443 RepID=UPI0007149AA9|nr:MarR family winged helix-turn-helix transcriptional regulator [Brevundimonas sp. Root1279]KQW82515.1 hypothetical protein ASC65_09840 [Brevundimonas sp. Root1279]